MDRFYREQLVIKAYRKAKKALDAEFKKKDGDTHAEALVQVDNYAVSVTICVTKDENE